MDINECKASYQLRTSLVKDDRGDLLADLHNILIDGRIASVSC
jgi:hypothetical protein